MPANERLGTGMKKPSINQISTTVVAILIAVFLSFTARADAFGGDNDFLPVEQAYLVSFTIDDSTLTADWQIAPGYYLYKSKFKLNAFVEGRAKPLEFTAPAGKVHYDQYLEKEVEIYYNEAHQTASIAALPQQFILKIQSQGCADAGLCYAPRTQYFDINRDFGTAVETDKSAIAAASDSGSSGGNGAESGNPVTTAQASPSSFWVYLVFALAGGLILNLMPCVFPVLSLKALSFAAASGNSHSHHLHGWAYTGGVIGSFLIAAGLILIAKAAGEQTGWGFQLQYPPFVAAICLLFLVMGLSLSGFVQIGTRFMGLGQNLTAQSGYRGSFFTGVLAAVVASPCTGPLMAPALGFALTQPPLAALLIFVALGFGMALPFLLLSYSPALADMLPRPGAWMERLKELLAFPMYLTAVWLLFVFGRQVGMFGAAYLLCGAVALVFAIWLFKHLPDGKVTRSSMQATAVAALLFAGITVIGSEQIQQSEENSPWQAFSEELVAELRNNGQPVFVDFTADWCLTCKANEKLALSRSAFFETVREHNVALVKGDWTLQDPRISKVLEQFNRSGVPLYLVYPSDPTKAPEVLPQLLTQGLVIEAIKRAAGNSSVASQP